MPLQVDGPTRGYKRLANKVLASIILHRKLMGMVDWDIVVTFGEIPDTKDKKGVAMQTVAEPQYYKISLDIDLDSLHESDIHTYVRHEFLHALVWLYSNLVEQLLPKRTAEAVREIEERVTTDLENMPLWEILYRKK
jgi:hypothetical protein